MLKRLSFTLTVTASLTGLYWLYALVVTPRLAPRILSAQQRTRETRDELKFEPPPSNIQNAEQFLPDAAWAANAKFQIAMANGTIFTNSWGPVEEQRRSDEPQNLYEFRPFAMIWRDAHESGDGSAASKPPMTLVSESGLVQFSAEFNPVSRKYGRVIGGKLEGKVTANGPDGLTLRGRDFFFHEKSLELHSDAPVEFSFQQHRGTAEGGFTADLLPSTEPPNADQFLAIAGFRQVTLRGHVEMDLANESSPLHVSCDDYFQFKPEQLVASFQGNVIIQRHIPNDEPDQIKGDNVDLIFENDADPSDVSTPRLRGDAPAIMPILRDNGRTGTSVGGSIHEQNFDRQNESRASSASSSQFVPKELHATGLLVELASPSNGLTTLANSLIYRVAARTVELAVIPSLDKSKLQELTTVSVRHKPSGTELSSPRLKLTHDEAGQIVTAEGEGLGRMRRREPGTNEVQFSAKWQKEFHLKRDPASEMDLLTLTGGAAIQQPSRKSGLKGEQIQFWFDRPTPTADPPQRASVREKTNVSRSAVTVTANDTKPHSVPDLTKQGFRPRQLRALGSVVVISPQMNAQTKQFLLSFEDTSSAPSTQADEPKSKSKSKVRQAAGSKTSAGKRQTPKVPVEPLQLTADLIRANVRLPEDSRQVSSSDDLQAELTEVWTEGNVDIQQPRDGIDEPLRLLGERLHLRNASRDGQQVLHVFGQPAMIRARGFDIEGPEIFLDRPNNRIWIDGAGELRMPVKNDPVDGRQLGSPTLLTVWWKEKMLFDGQTATFLNGVEAALKNSRLKCEEMEVVLTERLSFRDDAGPPPTAEVQRVICKDGVHVDHTLYVNDDLTEIRHGEFATLTLDQTSGRMDAVGPGKIDLWRPGQGKRAALAPRAVAQANRPLESEVSNWDFTRITFQGKTVGNLRDRTTKFQDRVHITYGPVAHPLDTIDPDHLPKDGGDMECDSLQILQVKPAGTQKPHIELEAKGNAKLEGRTFNARADEITFDESKQLYTLRATGNRQVTIYRQTTPEGEPNELSAKSLWFIPSLNRIRSVETTGIRGTN